MIEILVKKGVLAVIVGLGWIYYAIRDARNRRKYAGYDDEPTEAEIAYLESYADAYVELYDATQKPGWTPLLYILAIGGMIVFAGGALWLCIESFKWITAALAADPNVLITTEAKVGPSILFALPCGLALLTLMFLAIYRFSPRFELFAAMSSTMESLGTQAAYLARMDKVIYKMRIGQLDMSAPIDVRSDILTVYRKQTRWTAIILCAFFIPFAATYAVDIRKTSAVTTDAVFYPAAYSDFGQRQIILLDQITTVKIGCKTDPFRGDADARYELHDDQERHFWVRISSSSLDEVWALDQMMRSRNVTFEHTKTFREHSRFMLTHCLDTAIPFVPDGRAPKIVDVFHLEKTEHDLFPELAAAGEGTVSGIPPLRR